MKFPITFWSPKPAGWVGEVRGGVRLPLCLPHHHTPLTCFVRSLPGKVLCGQKVQDVDAWTKADPLPHLGYLPNNNTASSV